MQSARIGACVLASLLACGTNIDTEREASEGLPTCPTGSHWPVDGDTTDVIQGYDGVSSGTPSFVDGHHGLAMDFDGDDAVRVPDAPALDVGTGNFSIGAWVNLEDHAGRYAVLGKYGGGSATPYFYFYVHYGQLRAVLRTATHTATVRSRTYVPAREWHHVALSVDRTSPHGLKLYVDGDEVSEYARQDDPTSIGNLDNDHDLGIGKLGQTNTYPFRGAIDDVKFVREPLTAEQVLAYTGECAPEGPSSHAVVSRWPLNGDAQDAVGPNDGVLVDSPEFVSSPGGQALHLEGQGGVEVLHDSMNVGTKDFSVSARVRVQDHLGRYAIAGKYNGSSRPPYYFLYVRYGQLQGVINTGTQQLSVRSADTLSPGTWHHVVFSVDRDSSDGLQLHIDGAEVEYARQGDPTGLGSLSSAYAFGIGKLGQTGIYPFKGDIDEVELMVESESGSGSGSGQPPPPPAMCDLVTDEEVKSFPSIPRPAYLQPFTDPVFQTTVVRVTDPGNEIPHVGGTWGPVARHHYSSDQAWNADQTLLMLDRGTSVIATLMK